MQSEVKIQSSDYRGINMKGDTYYEIDSSGKLENVGVSDPVNEKPAASNHSSSTAINEETGEINWDCPCLKSALAPPCGDFFREAFACFVASNAEPKGSDCIRQFSEMQDCFRAHPDIYMRGDETEGSKDDSVVAIE